MKARRTGCHGRRSQQNDRRQSPGALFLLLVCLTASPSRGEPAYNFLSPYTTLADTGLPVIQVAINRRVVANFLLDTGTNLCLISPDLVKKLSLPLSNRAPDGHSPVLEGRPVQVATVSELNVGGLPVRKASLALMPDEPRVKMLEVQCQGVIGANLLEKVSVSFDCQRHEVTFMLPGVLDPARLAQAGFSEADSVPLEDPAHLLHYTVPARLPDGTTEKLVLDTGSTLTYISFAAAKRLKLEPKRQSYSTGPAGVVPIHIGILPSVSLGELSLQNVEVAWSADESREVPPVVGMDLLKRLRFLIDIPQMKLYLKAPPTGPF